jgi:uncharacterized protein YdeI (YjbR/CyaY-like superfamily)
MNPQCENHRAVKPRFFATPADFRAWLAKHHDTANELLVGFYKRDSGKPSITWPESVDEALCFGWIDGVRKRLDDESYMIRFTPRKPRSIWSAININRAKELIALGRMAPKGLNAFEARCDERFAIYSYEQRKAAQLDAADEKQFRANEKAWDFFQAQPPGYRRLMLYWVTSAKRPDTRQKRLAELIDYSVRQRRIPRMAPSKKK